MNPPEEFCRLCLRVEGVVSVFSEDCINSWSLSDRIFECVSVKICENDDLPQTICTKCLQNVNAWCEFKTACDRLQRTWFIWLKSIYGPRQVVKRRLRDHARRRSLELGYWKRKDNWSPTVGGSKRPHQNFVEEDCIVIDDDEESTPSTETEVVNLPKRIRIESTHTLLSDQIPLENGFISQESSITQFDDTSKSTCLEPPSDSGLDVTEEAQIVVVDGVNNTEPQTCETEEHEDPFGNPPQTCETGEHKDPFGNPPQTCETEEPEDPSETSKSFELQVCQLKPLKQLAQLAVELLNKPEEVKQPSRLKDIVQNVLDLLKDQQDVEEPMETEKDVSLPEEEAVVSVNESQIFQPKMLKEYVQTVLDILDGKSTGPEYGPWPEDSAMYNPVPEKVQCDSEASNEKRPPTETPFEKTNSPILKNALLPATGESSIGDDSNSQANNDTEGNVSISIPVDCDVSHQSETSLAPLDFSPQEMVRVKEEPLSDEDILYDNEYDYSVYDYSIKTEPSDSTTPSTVVNPVTGSPRGSWKKKLYRCTICLTKLSHESSYLRHLNSALHRKIASAVSAGRRVTPVMKRFWASEIKSDAKKVATRIKSSKNFKQVICKEKPVSLNRRRDSSSTSSSVDGVKANVKKNADDVIMKSASVEGLGKCNLCNLTFKSRSLKVKHVNSPAHKLAVQQLEASMRPPVSPVKHLVQPAQQLLAVPLVKPINKPPSQMVTYTCPFAECSMSFLDGGQLIVHMHSHGISMPMRDVQDQVKKNTAPSTPKAGSKEVEKRFKCQYGCGAAFTSSISVNIHYRSCKVKNNHAAQIVKKEPEVDNELVCHVCNVSCINKRSLQYHVKKWHGGKSVMHKCPKCPKKFGSILLLKRHVVIHRATSNNKRKLVCKVCKKTFGQVPNLQSHLRKHFNAGKDKYFCFKCLKPLNGQEAWFKHRVDGCSIKLKIFSCSQCGNSYNSQRNLDIHIAESHPVVNESSSDHSDDDPVVEQGETYCKLCRRGFSSHHSYARHMVLHQPAIAEGVRSFKCNTCSSSFPNRIMRDSHKCVKVEVDQVPSPASGNSLSVQPTAVDSDSQIGRRGVISLTCRYCNRKYSSLKSLYAHLRISCAERNRKCVHCGQFRNPKRTDVVCIRCHKSQRIFIEDDFLTVNNDAKSTPKQPSVINPPAVASSSGTSTSRDNVKQGIESLLFKCPLGNRRFLSQKALGLHAASCSGTCKDLPVYCKLCQSKYPNPIVYLKHKPCKKKGRGGTKLTTVCHICRRNFQSRKSLWAHIRRIHKTSLDDASKKGEGESPPTRSSSRVSKPVIPKIESSDGDDDIESVTPSEVSTSSAREPGSSLIENSPLVSAHNANDFIPEGSVHCPSCDLPFSAYGNLKRHLTSTHREVFYLVACPFCDKKVFKRELYSHGFDCITSNLYSSESLECAFCGTIFYENDDASEISTKLQHHILSCGGKLPLRRSHCYKKPLLCLHCCSVFYDPLSLQRHMVSKHNISSPENPGSQVFLESSESSYKYHLENATNNHSPLPLSEAIDCSLADKASLVRKAVAKKRTTPPVAVALQQQTLHCKYCSRSFHSLLKLHNHEKVHGIVKKNVCINEDYEDDDFNDAF